MTVEPFFSQTYDEARSKFLTAAQARGLRIERHLHPDAVGPSGEQLSIDIALFSPEVAEALLIVTSGVHGVEGFCGSGCQTGLLHDDELFARLAASKLALLFVHAVNPYGFAHLRRVNEDNVDLNRNSVDFAEAASANPAYLEVDPLLLPRTWPPSQADQAALLHYMATRGPNGERALQDAATSGQYRMPDGMFYGGEAPCWSTLQMRSVVSHHAAGMSRVVWIDLHTGLGHYGHGEKIFNSADPAELARALRTWGADVRPIAAAGSVSSVVKGDLVGIAYELLPGVEKTCVTLEFGTLPPLAVLQALRADHWLYRHPEQGAEQAPGIRRALRDAFYCDVPEWKGMVFAQTRMAVLQAVAQFSG